MLSPHEAAQEILRRRAARTRLLAFATYTLPTYEEAAHHQLICSHLERVERGECRRLMIFMPPRHGKSELASRRFPAWFMGRNPAAEIIAASYNADLAADFGREVRAIVASEEYQALFPGVVLRQDSKAADRWHVSGGGAYRASGVGTAMTGRGADLLLIDDPVKDREEADSELRRDRVWDWYRSTAYTRLSPSGRIVVIQCMTGDTPVLMPDGSEKALREIRAGDAVATYQEGRLTVSKVVNWVNQGPDLVYEIRTTCGKMVKANERHPFLVYRNGELVWVRLRNLRIGDEIVQVDGKKALSGVANAATKDAAGQPTLGAGATVTTRSTGKTPSAITANGSGRSAPLRAATNPSLARAFAELTICETGGPAAIGLRPPSTRTRYETVSFVTDMESEPPNTISCSPSRAASVRSAEEKTTRDRQITGRRSLSITATKPAASAGCSATTVTSWSEGGATSRFSSGPLDTFGVTKGRIASIRLAGREDVFDIQVERTENFIAGGLVSHNTRWHEDDLSGRLLEQMHQDGDQWEVLSLPALMDGRALWEERFPVDRLEAIRRTIGPREWSALYQQQPQPDEGTFFQRDWLQSWSEQPKNLRIYGTSDYAVTDGGGDFTVHRIWGVDPNGDLYRLDGWCGQTAADVWIERKLDLIEKWRPFAWFGEAGVIQKAIEPMLLRRMRERDVTCRLEWLPSIADKPTRARGFQARAAMGRVRFEPNADVGQFLMFPVGKHDDEVDAASLIGRALDMAHPAIVTPQDKPPGPLKGVNEMTFNEALSEFGQPKRERV